MADDAVELYFILRKTSRGYIYIPVGEFIL